ncbi:hypothetical protein CGRA01v4_12475 [Colletotrichum graminicola]|nr:hypothetical protein CGRA01v4_12475 [Colletotrichum graminicola]
MYVHGLRLSPSPAVLCPFLELSEKEAEDMMLLAAAASVRSPSTDAGFRTVNNFPSGSPDQPSFLRPLNTSSPFTAHDMDIAEERGWAWRGVADATPTETHPWVQIAEAEDPTMCFLDDHLYLPNDDAWGEEGSRQYRLSDLVLDAAHII